MSEGQAVMRPNKTREDLGLAITHLDSDRLRQWADKFDVHGTDISHWADRRFVSEQLRAIAGRIEATVAEVGTLRELAGIHPDGEPSAHLASPLTRATVAGARAFWKAQDLLNAMQVVAAESMVAVSDPHRTAEAYRVSLRVVCQAALKAIEMARPMEPQVVGVDGGAEGDAHA